MLLGLKVFQLEHEQAVGVAGVNCVKIVGNRIISCGTDRTTRIWDIETKKELHKFKHPAECFNFDLNRERTLLAVAHGAGFSIWDFSSQMKIKEEKSKKVKDLRFNESGTVLIVGKEAKNGGKIHLFDLAKSSSQSQN